MRHLLILLTFTICLLHIDLPAEACTAFMLDGDGYRVVGFNENWKPMAGMVLVNKRGNAKQSLSWRAMVSSKAQKEPTEKWISRYGSVTFSCLGVDLPCYGVNEKGLFIVELFLDNTYSIADPKRPSMFWGQWIQHTLDSFASVEDVVKHLDKAATIDWWPTFPGSHFFVSDKNGTTAAIEFIKGKPVVSYGDTMPIHVLCNDTYQKERSVLKTYKAFGGDKEFDMTSYAWENRFYKAAHLLQQYPGPKSIRPVDYSWTVLDGVISGTWQLVADIQNKKLYFKTDQSKNIKSIDLTKCNFSQNTPTQYIDMHTQSTGDVTSLFRALTPEINREYVEKGFPTAYENADFYKSTDYKNLLDNLYAYVKRLK